MTHFAASSFWHLHAALPKSIRTLAGKNFRLLVSNFSDPSLNFKPAGKYWSAHIGPGHRMIAVKSGHEYIWCWIGTIEAYERLIQ